MWTEHASAWNVFLSCNTQWRVIAGASSMHWIGLDYIALDMVRRVCGVEEVDWPDVFEQVQIMENEALTLFNR
ncbi:DUF1799 domain-containing protein [Hylemonella sp. W303a]|uniref:DUF1799 domain-containing protein n=1 Tax=Hylemonella sp. W303a TaxID=3389873 RepID=UPI00396B2155